MRSFRLQGWEFIAALASGGAAAWALRSNAYAEATSEIVTVLGFLMAALVPAMMLGATAVRAGSFSVRVLRSLSVGIDRQIIVFAGLFLYSLLACVVAIAGKLTGWEAPDVRLPFELGSLDLAQGYPAALTFLFVLLLLRSLAFVAGVRSILRLVAQMAEDEARSRDRKSDEASNELAGYRNPVGYGTQVELPKERVPT